MVSKALLKACVQRNITFNSISQLNWFHWPLDNFKILSALKLTVYHFLWSLVLAPHVPLPKLLVLEDSMRYLPELALTRSGRHILYTYLIACILKVLEVHLWFLSANARSCDESWWERFTTATDVFTITKPEWVTWPSAKPSMLFPVFHTRVKNRFMLYRLRKDLRYET